ncbi:TPA: diguanylate cyclase [Burkholderia vietnamiensis]|nr:diguanylate cyclase [Burkholderia vietnamiensis]HDR9064185.1 diguanylate cyclase [Burkholderia vietnamiensis]HDR9158901.1 diguanylate cyclase [Burkholderia vietnamiensis]
MPSRLFRSANADRIRFIVLHGFMTVCLLAAAGLFLYEAHKIVRDEFRDEQAFAVLGAANRVLHDLENAETGQRGYLLTLDESYLAPYQQGVQDLDDTVLRLQQVAANDEATVELVRHIERAKTQKVSELARTIELARSGNRQGAIAFVQTGEGKRYMDELRQRLGVLMDDWRYKRKLAVQDAQGRLVFAGAALATIAVLVCGVMIYTVVIQRRAFAKVHAYSEALNEQAAHDALTGLPNRRSLLAALDELAARGGSQFARVGLLYLDIDGFKAVNDTLGHGAGDRLLRQLADAFSMTTRQNDMLARVGGDEFVLLARGCDGDQQLRDLAGCLISSVRTIGEREYGGRFSIGVSIGIATYPDRVTMVEGMLDSADAAMYAAKRAGGSKYRFSGSPNAGFSNVVRLTG